MLVISKGIGLYQALALYLNSFKVKIETLIFLINFSEEEIEVLEYLRQG